MGKKAVRGGSLRAKVTGWLGAILLVMLLSIGLAAAVGRGTLRAFDGLLEDNAACYTVQEALAAETKAFARYVRESSQESEAEYAAACAATAESLDKLPLDYAAIGEDRYARTWNLLQGYAGYCVYRDAFFQMSPAADGYVREMYHVMALQDFLSEYALRLTQATLEQQSGVYRARSTLLARMPWLYLGLAAAAVAGMLFLLRALSATVVVPLLGLAGASRRIAQNDFSGGDLPVRSGDEVGQLVRTFNQMKHAMAQFRTTQEALHREEVRNLTLKNDLEHTRLEVLKSQVDPHFLFNTLNMISCMARLEDASATDQMIVRLGGLFRHNLRTKAQVIPLEEELDGLDDYIYLQQMRFDGRITVEKEVLVDPAAVRVPSFTLQPIVENAFSHGLKACEEGGRILLRVWQRDDRLFLTVADNGRGMSPEELDALQQKMRRSEQTGRSIGLGNIFRRVSMLYPDGGMKIFSREGHGTVARFEIPQKSQENQEREEEQP